jgi:hypothetical protein
MWQLVIGVVLAAVGFAIFRWPLETWYLFEGWRYANPESLEPSETALVLRRISALIALVIGIILVIVGVLHLAT